MAGKAPISVGHCPCRAVFSGRRQSQHGLEAEHASVTGHDRGRCPLRDADLMQNRPLLARGASLVTGGSGVATGAACISGKPASACQVAAAKAGRPRILSGFPAQPRRRSQDRPSHCPSPQLRIEPCGGHERTQTPDAVAQGWQKQTACPSRTAQLTLRRGEVQARIRHRHRRPRA